ncbi:S9 family peptidase [Hymenobacter aquaticus]|uniref:S9 family peptidase n=1 Tax=Hymenobacter aquaticus TaxID=1867101 RepID=A0A4Z0Q910_9BACT|nr:prolyl oligopeptidase family serine peptidase [Hymenobacter aquaticus]TGE25879.1 S9 family peptidase [Hymenobacter aquaticus]
MKHAYVLLAAFGLLVSSVRAQQRQLVAPLGPVTDTYFGVKVTDPYRNLENPADPAGQAWQKAQAAYARHILDAIPGRQQLLEQMQSFENRKATAVTSLVVTDNNRYFYLKTRPLDQQPKLYCRNGYGGAETLLFDPASLALGPEWHIAKFQPAYDGSKVVVGLRENGVAAGVLRVLDVQAKRLYPEKLAAANGEASWLPDNSGFVYSGWSSSSATPQVLLHRVGTAGSQEQPVFSAPPSPKPGRAAAICVGARLDRDTRLAYGVVGGTGRYLHVDYAPIVALATPAADWKPLFRPEQEVTGFVTDEQYIYFTTCRNAPHQMIMRMPAAAPDVARAEVLVSESPTEAVLAAQLKVTRDGLYFVRCRNGVDARLYFVAKAGPAVEPIELPEPAGSLTLATKNAQCSDLWVQCGGWLRAGQRYRYSAAGHRFMPEPLSTHVQYPEFANLTVEELLVPLPEGGNVPLSLLYGNSLARNGTAPVLLSSAEAGVFFSPPMLLWPLQGGVLAMVHGRGGEEPQAMQPTAWKDLIACAEYLAKQRYTSPGRLAISGRGAGGLLVGRALAERPELFGAAVAEAACLNPARQATAANETDARAGFGTAQNQAGFRALLDLDAYHHLRPNTRYPAVLLTASLNDPRGMAWQPAKFAARLQASTVSGKPVLFGPDAGAPSDAPRQKQREALADLLAFGLWQTGVPAFQPQSAAMK